jgi:5'-deoxynucleotidase YfbR-like HD superfamily hydrolase
MNIVKLFSISQSMSSINRYSQINLLHPESVLEHTGFVCLFTYMVCQKINSDCCLKVDVGKALEKATLHDMDEVVTGDIPRPTKYFSEESKEIFDKIAEQGLFQITKELEFNDDRISEKIKTNWISSKDGLEGRVVALADLAGVVYKIWEEVCLLSNKKLIPQGKQVYGYIESFSEDIDKCDIPDDQRFVFGNIITQLLNIAYEVKCMEDPMIGALSSLNNPEKN